MKKLVMLCAIALAVVALAKGNAPAPKDKPCCDKAAKCEMKTKKPPKECKKIKAPKAKAPKAPKIKAPEAPPPKIKAPKPNRVKYISRKAAIGIALKHAGVKLDHTHDLSCELDRENGLIVYDVEFDVGNMEYDYDIDARTGAVLKAWRERD